MNTVKAKNKAPKILLAMLRAVMSVRRVNQSRATVKKAMTKAIMKMPLFWLTA